MKFIIAFFAICCVSSVFGENPFGLTDAHLEAMKHIDANKLPAIFQQKRDASHWCCANEQPISTIQKTRVVKEIHTVATKVKTGYTECGFLSTMRCSLYSTKYKQVAVYHVGTYEIPDETACFDHHVVCCKGFIEVANNCWDVSVVGDNLDLILALVNAGLIQTVNNGRK